MAKKTILAVEDNDDARRLLTMMLTSLGFDVRAFPDGNSALEELRNDDQHNRQVHLALLDIMMPNMNGYQLLDELKKIPQYESIPVIMVTAKDADTEVLEGYQHGADYYITKPFTLQQLQYGINLYLQP